MYGEIPQTLIVKPKTREIACLPTDTMVLKYYFYKKFKTVISEQELWKDGGPIKAAGAGRFGFRTRTEISLSVWQETEDIKL